MKTCRNSPGTDLSSTWRHISPRTPDRACPGRIPRTPNNPETRGCRSRTRRKWNRWSFPNGAARWWRDAPCLASGRPARPDRPGCGRWSSGNWKQKKKHLYFMRNGPRIESKWEQQYVLYCKTGKTKDVKRLKTRMMKDDVTVEFKRIYYYSFSGFN